MEWHENRVKCNGVDELLLPDQPVKMQFQLQMLRNSIKISGDNLCIAIRNAANPRPLLFEKSPLLKNLYPLWLEGGQVVIYSNGKPIHVKLDSRLGLLIERQKGMEHD